MSLFQILPTPDWSILVPLQTYVLFCFIKASALSPGGINCQTSQSLVMLSLKYTAFTYRKLYLFAVTASCVLLEWDKVNRHRRQTVDFLIMISKNSNLIATAMVIVPVSHHILLFMKKILSLRRSLILGGKLYETFSHRRLLLILLP